MERPAQATSPRTGLCEGRRWLCGRGAAGEPPASLSRRRSIKRDTKTRLYVRPESPDRIITTRNPIGGRPTCKTMTRNKSWRPGKKLSNSRDGAEACERSGRPRGAGSVSRERSLLLNEIKMDLTFIQQGLPVGSDARRLRSKEQTQPRQRTLAAHAESTARRARPGAWAVCGGD